MKVCTCCHHRLPATPDYFSRAARHKDGLRYHCKKCSAEKARVWHQKNIEQARAAARLRAKISRETDREGHRASRAAWSKNNQAKVRAMKAARRARNLDEQRKKDSTYAREREARDPAWKLHRRISNMVGFGLRNAGGKSWRSWPSLLGYTAKELAVHLERQFQRGMTWENYGKGPGTWQIDHIVPRAAFNYESADDPAFKVCWALTNLQPLWSVENRKKADRRVSLL